MGVKVREKSSGSGEWWVFIDHQGRRKAKKIGRDKKTALQIAKQIEARLVLGDVGLLEQNDECKTPTLRQYVDGWKDNDGQMNPGWFDKQAKLALKRSTWLIYRNLLDNHILPRLGDHALDEITSRMVSDFAASKFAQGLRA